MSRWVAQRTLQPAPKEARVRQGELHLELVEEASAVAAEALDEHIPSPFSHVSKPMMVSPTNDTPHITIRSHTLVLSRNRELVSSECSTKIRATVFHIRIWRRQSHKLQVIGQSYVPHVPCPLRPRCSKASCCKFWCHWVFFQFFMLQCGISEWTNSAVPHLERTISASYLPKI